MSIQARMIEMIQEAKHYIYIENQFFISSTAGDGNDGVVNAGDPNSVLVYNTVVQALLDRLHEAIRSRQVFRVIIIIPAYPEGGMSSISNKGIVHLQFMTIARSNSAILRQLANEYPGLDLSQYITFHTLRQHAVLPAAGHVTNLIYVHSKTMIVDDRHVLIGSANLNDRSLMGVRDTELSVHCYLNETNADENSEDRIEIQMNGEPFVASKLVHNLRMDLMREHLGLPANDTSMEDVLSDKFWRDVWLDTSFSNYVLYTTVFPNIPSNVHSTLASMKAAYNGSVAPERLSLARGHLMMYPLQWLSQENLWPASLEACSITQACYFALT
eukprot:TRINITY_DN12856_c0_g1_i3.p1 TRINITY_DN12856_c0_g1~~TRINITY_DN12856_c0_g1_i3.p1  ORF type:complete len:369 (-),score=47.71 TRINITY_DN12856_c0_g1_i3:44-1030(-)